MRRQAERTFEELEDELRTEYWHEVRLLAEELATDFRRGALGTPEAVLDEAGVRSHEHPWTCDEDRAQYVLWCSENASVGASGGALAGDAIVRPDGTLDWCFLARLAFFEDLVEMLVSHCHIAFGEDEAGGRVNEAA